MILACFLSFSFIFRPFVTFFHSSKECHVNDEMESRVFRVRSTELKKLDMYSRSTKVAFKNKGLKCDYRLCFHLKYQFL